MSMQDQIIKMSYDLHLHGLNEHALRRSEEAIAQSLHPLEFLRLLLDDEKQWRKNQLATKLVAKAGFRHSADLEDWDHTFDRGVSKAKLRDLAQLGFYYNRENLLLYGRTGEGKTHLAIALGKRLCQAGVVTYFFSFNLLFEEVAAAKAAGKYLGFIKKLTKAGVLVFDDFGLRNYSHEEATILIDILESRYQKGSIIVTSQIDARGWDKLFEDSVIKEAIVNRLTFPSQSVTLAGGSYRERLGKERKQQKNH